MNVANMSIESTGSMQGSAIVQLVMLGYLSQSCVLVVGNVNVYRSISQTHFAQHVLCLNPVFGVIKPVLQSDALPNTDQHAAHAQNIFGLQKYVKVVAERLQNFPELVVFRTIYSCVVPVSKAITKPAINVVAIGY
jgi:hypothetical protein